MAVTKSMPILIVDDANTAVRVLRNQLRQLGFSNIDEASSGNTALAKLRAKNYALVISDRMVLTGAASTPVLMVANDREETAQSLKTKLVSVLGAF